MLTVFRGGYYEPHLVDVEAEFKRATVVCLYMTSISDRAGKFKIQVCLTSKPGFFALYFHSFLGGGHHTLIQQVSIEHHLYSSPVLGVVRDTEINQIDTVSALMEPSQLHL